jgi:hypothetical protein
MGDVRNDNFLTLEFAEKLPEGFHQFQKIGMSGSLRKSRKFFEAVLLLVSTALKREISTAAGLANILILGGWTLSQATIYSGNGGASLTK